MPAITLDRRDDGSLVLFLDGDLQFDSRDERIYHETLTLPALALAQMRCGGFLRVLVCGGGDGLTARELLKSPAVGQIDLVDYDPHIVALARTGWPDLHEGSFDDPRLTVHHDDAWAFAERTAQAGERYHLIISDLTVPQDRLGARLQSIDWYERLAAILVPQGLLATNALSPTATADAYWSIYNAIRTAGLSAKPYRIHLPSFADQGYGPDWGFFLASPQPIAAAELTDDLPLAAPRQALKNVAQLRRLFRFPMAVAERREAARPAGAGSDLLLRYVGSAVPVADGGPDWDALRAGDDATPVPAGDDGLTLLPDEVRGALGETGIDEAGLMERVLALMPSLHAGQTRAMVSAILEEPLRFLESFDLKALVEALLLRAAQLPAAFVAELKLLSERAHEAWTDREAFLRQGWRVITVITVVMILANLIYPDSAYAKGGGFRGHDSTSIAHVSHGRSHYAEAPTTFTRSGYRSKRIGRGETIDEDGAVYPSRRFRYRSRLSRSVWVGHHHGHRTSHSRPHGSDQSAQAESFYRLTPEADVLLDGQIALALNERAYLMIDGPDCQLVDQQSGEPVMDLKLQPALVTRLSEQFNRQLTGLERSIENKRSWIRWASWLDFVYWRRSDIEELLNLETVKANLQVAKNKLAAVGLRPSDKADPPVAGAIELAPSLWLPPDGSGVIIERADGQAMLIAARTVYADPYGRQEASEPYPTAFRGLVQSMLKQEVKDFGATYAAYQTELAETRQELASLQRDRAEYTRLSVTGTGQSESVDYGSSEVSLGEALRRTNADIALAEKEVRRLEDLINRHPQETMIVRLALERLQ